MIGFKRAIVVTGTPGVGKTVVSNLLASRIGALHVDLADLVKCEGLSLGFDEKRESLIADLEGVSRRVREIVQESSKDVIIEGHYAPGVVPQDLASFVIVLRRDPEELRIKLEEKGFRGGKISENVAAEVLDVCLWDAVVVYGLGKVSEIDGTGKDPNEVVEEIIAIMEGREEMRVGKVDWLSKLEKEGKLDNYLNWL